MSDYLTNVAARSLNSTPAIQPRLMSLFEPLSGLGPIFPTPAPAGEQFENVAEHHDSKATRILAPISDHESEPSPMDLVTTKRTDHEKSTHTDVDHQVEQAERVEQLSTEAQPLTLLSLIDERGETDTSQRDDGSQAKKILPAIPTEVGVRRPEKTALLSPASSAISAKTVVPISDLHQSRETSYPEHSDAIENVIAAASRTIGMTQPENADNQTDGNVEHRAEPIHHHIVSPSPTLVVPRAVIETIRSERVSQPLTKTLETTLLQDTDTRKPIVEINSRRVSRIEAPRNAVEPARPESQPTVNVTIGRVEVRASLPASSRSSAQNSESPKLMGLSEYLRQRARGGKE